VILSSIIISCFFTRFAEVVAIFSIFLLGVGAVFALFCCGLCFALLNCICGRIFSEVFFGTSYLFTPSKKAKSGHLRTGASSDFGGSTTSIFSLRGALISIFPEKRQQQIRSIFVVF
jgi:hypothetical protein